MKKTCLLLLLSFLIGALGGAAAALGILQWRLHSPPSLIAEFYAVENAVHVSPHSLRKKMAEGKEDFVLVDLRSGEEYEEEHIAGAISIPAYINRDTADYGAVDRIVAAFRALPESKDVIVYCYSIPCMTGRKIGKMLAEHGIYVKHLGIGWNEWRHFWTLWNHKHEWAKTKPEDYVVSGHEPGKPKVVPTIVPCTEGEFGC